MPMSALCDLGSKVNAIYPIFVKELSFSIRPTDVKAQKIDSTMLDMFGIIVVAFSLINKANQVKFFKETFLVANISLEVVFRMFFYTLSGTDVDFLG